MASDGFVLVHGGCHGAWCWDPVRPLLEHPSVAVDLPGRGNRPARGVPVTLDLCVDAVIEDADAAGFSRFVLVGHSMGGLTITETANRHPDRVDHLVYVAALALPPGETVLDHYFPDGDAATLQDPGGVMPLPDESLAHQLFSGDLDPDEFAAIYRQCVPEVIGLLTAAVSGYGSGVPATYLRCTRDRGVSKEATGEMVARLEPIAMEELDSDHDVMLSHPELLARFLNSAWPR